jgi:hypothetical protein
MLTAAIDLEANIGRGSASTVHHHRNPLFFWAESKPKKIVSHSKSLLSRFYVVFELQKWLA